MWVNVNATFQATDAINYPIQIKSVNGTSVFQIDPSGYTHCQSFQADTDAHVQNDLYVGHNLKVTGAVTAASFNNPNPGTTGNANLVFTSPAQFTQDEAVDGMFSIELADSNGTPYAGTGTVHIWVDISAHPPKFCCYVGTTKYSVQMN